MKRVVAYLRISSKGQDLANQRFCIDKYCSDHRIVITEYIGETMSGKIPIYKRKAGNILRSMKCGETLIVSELSRLSRNKRELVELMEMCAVNGVKIHSIKESFILRNNTESMDLVKKIAFSAQHERELISMRVKESMARLKKDGIILGRRPGRKTDMRKRKLDSHKETILRLIKNKVPKMEIAHQVGTNRVTLNKYLNDIAI